MKSGIFIVAIGRAFFVMAGILALINASGRHPRNPFDLIWPFILLVVAFCITLPDTQGEN